MTPETLDKIIDLTVANFPMSQNIDLLNVGKLWTEHFGEIPDDLLETAFHMILEDAKYWPSVKDIKDAITELKQDSYQSNILALNQPEISTDSRKDAIDKIKKIKELIASGNTAKLKEFTNNIDIEHLRGYAKYLFPEISDSLIRKNFGILDYAKTAAEECGGCKWHDASKCPTGGYYPTPKIEKDGYIKIYMSPCKKKELDSKQKQSGNMSSP